MDCSRSFSRLDDSLSIGWSYALHLEGGIVCAHHLRQAL
jgi:hypothetical protein